MSDNNCDDLSGADSDSTHGNDGRVDDVRLPSRGEAQVEIRRSPPEGRHLGIHQRKPLPPVPTNEPGHDQKPDNDKKGNGE